MPRPACALALAAVLLLTPAAGRLAARVGLAVGNALAHSQHANETMTAPDHALGKVSAAAGPAGVATPGTSTPEASTPGTSTPNPSAPDVSMPGALPVGVAERLGQQADLDATFAGEDGAKLRLRDLVTMPTLLVPVYFSCPNECNVLLGTLVNTLPQVGLKPGRDYQVLAVSFNDQDTPATAAKRKGDFLNAGALATAQAGAAGFPPQAWRFLTGDGANIRRLMNSIGFGFQRKGDDFVHTVVLVALSPTGKITRYLYGIRPLPFDLAMAATEAAGGRTGLSVQRAVAMCYTYDPQGRRYVFDIMKVTGAGVLAALGLFGLFLAFGGKKRGAPPRQ